MKRTVTLLLTLGVSLSSHAGQYSFGKIWQSAKKESLSAKSYSAKLEAIETATARAAKHWFPRLYLESSIYETNDPAYSFMGKLNQGKIEMADLIGSSGIAEGLNDPTTKQYQKHTLGAYLPLFEGGQKFYMKESQDRLYEATKYEKQHADQILYTEIVKLVGMYFIAQETQDELAAVKKEVSKIINNYKLGSKKNPLGRSGLLGLKTLKLQIDAYQDQVETSKTAILSSLSELSHLSVTEIDRQSVQEFINSSLIQLTPEVQDKNSYKLSSLKKMAEVARARQKAARAAYLPQVGIFAQSNSYTGDRATNTSQMVGLSLKWEFFNLSNWSAPTEAGKYALAAETYAAAMKQQEELENNANHSKQAVITQNIKRLKIALSNFKEQTRINYRLFRNGIINALQMGEVLSRKIQILNHIGQAQEEYLKSCSTVYLNNHSQQYK